MAQYSVPFRSQFGAASSAIAEFVAGPTSYPVIHEIGFEMLAFSAGVAPQFGVGKPAAQGIGPRWNPAITPDDAAQAKILASDFQVAIDWKTKGPTLPAAFYRRFSLGPGAAAAPMTWGLKFPRGIKMAPSSSVVLWGFTGFVLDAWVSVEL